MNRSFRLVWNAALGLWAVASEAAKSKHKPQSSSKIPKLKSCVLGSVLIAGIGLMPLSNALADVTWNGGDGSWTDPSKWDSGVPAGTDNVIFTTGTVDVTTTAVAGDINFGSNPGDGVSVNVKGSSASLTAGSLAVGDGGGSAVKADLTVSDGATVDIGGLTIGDDYNDEGIVTVSGSGTSLEASSIKVGGGSTIKRAILTLSGGAQVGSSGNVSIGKKGFINIGAAENASAVEAGTFSVESGKSVRFYSSGGKLVFNHTNTNYVFAPDITGTRDESNINIVHGTTRFTGDLSGYAGNTNVKGGTLSIAEQNNLGTGDLGLSGGTLEVTDDTTLANAVTLTADKTSTVSVASDKSVTASGVISGSGALTKSGAGKLTLSGDNTGHTGGTTVTAGTLSIATQNNLGTGDLTLDGGTLAVTETIDDFSKAISTTGANSAISIASDKTVTASGVISGSGALTKSGAGTLKLSVANTYTGGTTVSEGTLSIGEQNNLGTGDLTLDGGTLAVTETIDDFSKAISTTGANSAISIASEKTVTASGDISGAGALTKSGAGTLVLSNTSSNYSGVTTVTEGTLKAAADDAFSSSSDFVVNGTLDLGDHKQELKSLAGTSTDAEVKLGSAALSLDQASNKEYKGKITGTGALTKSGAGTLTLSGANTYTGGTTVSEGTLSIGGQNNLGTGDLGLNGGTLEVTDTTTLANKMELEFTTESTINVVAGKRVTASGAMKGRGYLVKSGSGTLTLSAGNNYGDYAGKITVNSGVLQLGDGTTDANFDSTIEASSGSSVNFNNQNDQTFHRNIKGDGALIKTGAGKLTLSYNNANYTGDTTVSAGTLSISEQRNLGTGALVLNGGILEVTSDIADFSKAISTTDANSAISVAGVESVTISGVISGSGALTKSGTGAMTLSGTNTYSGGTTISGGTLSIADEKNLGTGALTLSGGTLEVTDTVTLENLMTLTANKVNTVSTASNKSVTASGLISGTGALSKLGEGKLTLSGENTYSGGTTISDGTLSIAAQNNLGTGDLVLSGGTLAVTETIDDFSKAISTTDANSAISVASDKSVTASGVISGSGALTKSGAGTLTLSGANTYTGGTTISGGTLQIGNGGTTGSVTGDIELASETKLNFNRSDAVTFGGNITGSGDVFINSGTVSFANGVSGTNSLTNKAILSIADGKTTRVGGDYTQESSGTLKIGASSLTKHGKLNVAGTATFAKDSKIDVDVSETNSLAAGTMTKVVEAGELTSDGFVVTDNSALFDFTASVDGNNVNLIVVQGTDDSNNKATVLKSVKNQNFTAGLGAATVLDKFVQGGTTGTGIDAVVTALGKISTGKEVSDAVAQTLPLLSGSTSKVSSGVMQANGNVVAARQSSTASVSSGGRSVETGTSSGDGFISDKNAWVKPVGSWAKQDSRGGVSGYDAETYGIIGGMDGDINDNTSVGFALSYMNTKADGRVTSTTNHADIDAYQVMFYGQRSLGESFHNVDVTWQAGLGVNQTDGTRNINFMSTTAKSDYTSYTGNLSAGLGRTFAINGDTSLTPSVRADYSYIKDESYKETGADALNLNVRSNTAEAFLISINGDLNQRINDSLSWAASAGVGYDVMNETSSLTASYAGGGTAFTTEGLELSPWVVSAGVGVNYALDDATEITVRYDLEGRSDFLSQTATAKFTWVF
jgi:autotransporter-associated beta strand protein